MQHLWNKHQGCVLFWGPFQTPCYILLTGEQHTRLRCAPTLTQRLRIFYNPIMRATNIFEYTKLKTLSVFIGILSAPLNFEARDAIRATWLVDPPIKLVHKFIIARPADPSIDFQTEITKYDDIMVMHWNREDYYTIANKTLEIFRIAAAFSKEFKFTHVFKTDDDSYVRTAQLANILMECADTNAWIGHHNPPGGKPARALGGKWTLSAAEYPRETFPAWTNGILYGVTIDIARWILAHASLPIHLRLEDILFALWMELYENEQSVKISKCGKPRQFNAAGCARQDVVSHYITPSHMRCIYARGACCK